MNRPDEILERILREDPSPATLFLILEEQKAQGRHGLVIRECLKALNRFPGEVRIRGLLAESCLESGWFSRAEAELETATARIEEQIPLYLLQARVYSKTNRNVEALRAVEIFLAHAPDHAEALSLREALRKKLKLQKPRREEPRPDADAVQGPVSLTVPEIATATLAELYFAQGQIEEAISTYEKILSRDPQADGARARLEGLKALRSPDPVEKEAREKTARTRRKKEKIVKALENWRGTLKKKDGLKEH